MTIKEDILNEVEKADCFDREDVVSLTLKKVEEKIDNLLKSQVKNIPRFELQHLKQKLRGGE